MRILKGKTTLPCLFPSIYRRPRRVVVNLSVKINPADGMLKAVYFDFLYPTCLFYWVSLIV